MTHLNIPQEKTPASLRSAIREVEGSIWLANICIGPSSDESVQYIIERFNLAVARIATAYGSDAFRSDKERAAIHEIGHAITHIKLSSPLYSVRIRCFHGEWCGFCDGGGAFIISPDIDALADLQQILLILAGFNAESAALPIEGAEGSSLDERFVGDFLIAKLAHKCGWNYHHAGRVIKTELFRALYAQKHLLLRAAKALCAESKLNEAQLRTLLASVPPDDYLLTKIYDLCVENNDEVLS